MILTVFLVLAFRLKVYITNLTLSIIHKLTPRKSDVYGQVAQLVQSVALIRRSVWDHTPPCPPFTSLYLHPSHL